MFRLCFHHIVPADSNLDTCGRLIVQFDPPDDPRDYIHRVGRTARGANGRAEV
jgi:ERCC4-related helicase